MRATFLLGSLIILCSIRAEAQQIGPSLTIDTDGKAGVSREELDAAIAALTKAAPTQESDIPEIKSGEEIRTAILLRDAYPAEAYITAGGTLPKKGALFSLTQDYKSDKDQLVAKGALSYAIMRETENYSGHPDDFRMTHMALVTGVEFDARFNSDNDKVDGSLTPKFGIELETNQGGPFPVQYWKVDGSYTTDYQGEASIYGGTAMWQPLTFESPIGKTYGIPSAGAWLTFIPTLNIDYAHVGSNGAFKALESGSDYLWVGPKISAELAFEKGSPLERLSLYAKYFYLYNVLGDGDDSINYLQTGAKIDIVKDLSAVELRYTNGNTPRTLEDANELYLGLTLAFGSLASPDASAKRLAGQ